MATKQLNNVDRIRDILEKTGAVLRRPYGATLYQFCGHGIGEMPRVRSETVTKLRDMEYIKNAIMSDHYKSRNWPESEAIRGEIILVLTYLAQPSKSVP